MSGTDRAILYGMGDEKAGPDSVEHGIHYWSKIWIG